MPTEWTCSTVDASTTQCTVTASVFYGVNYHDWIFVAMIVVGMLALITWPRIFRPLKTLFYGD